MWGLMALWFAFTACSRPSHHRGVLIEYILLPVPNSVTAICLGWTHDSNWARVHPGKVGFFLLECLAGKISVWASGVLFFFFPPSFYSWSVYILGLEVTQVHSFSLLFKIGLNWVYVDWCNRVLINTAHSSLKISWIKKILCYLRQGCIISSQGSSMECRGVNFTVDPFVNYSVLDNS